MPLLNPQPEPREQMTPEAQRIAIAEAHFDHYLTYHKAKPFQRDDHSLLAYGGGDSFGLWIYRTEDGCFVSVNYKSEQALREGEIQKWAKRHNYLSDLNAMHEAEKVLTTDKAQDGYHDAICNILIGESSLAFTTNFSVLCATAAQRAEAFLRTLGKWAE